MEIDKKLLTKELEKIKYELSRKQSLKGFENEINNIDDYEQLLLFMGEIPKERFDSLMTTSKQMRSAKKSRKIAINEICDFINQNSEIIQKGFNNFEQMLSKDNTFQMAPTYNLKKINLKLLRELLFEYYSQYGDNIYKIIKKYMDEKRVYYGNLFEPGIGGTYLSSKITKSGYINIEEYEKMTMITLAMLVHELGHAIDAETLEFPQSKNINIVSDLLLEVPSIHFEMGFIDFLIKNNIYIKDAHAILQLRYDECSYLMKSFDKFCGLEHFYINESGYVTDEYGTFIDEKGEKIEMLESCEDDGCDDIELPLPMDMPTTLKYGLGTYIASQTNELASQDRKAYVKDFLNFTTQRKESSFIESLERLGISEEQFTSASIIKPRIEQELKLTKKMWNFK